MEAGAPGGGGGEPTGGEPCPAGAGVRAPAGVGVLPCPLAPPATAPALAASATSALRGSLFYASHLLLLGGPASLPAPKQAEEEQRAEQSQRRKRWRDKQKRRFNSLRSITSGGAGSVSAGGTPRAAGGDLEEGGGAGHSSGSEGGASPKSRDIGGILQCLGGESAVREAESPKEGRRGGSKGGGSAKKGSGGGGGGGGGGGTVTFEVPAASPLAAAYSSEAKHISGDAPARRGPGEPGSEGQPQQEGAEEEQVIVGVITLEDVIEEMMGEEIVDEVRH
jgi:hypothetical protein